MKYLYLLLSFNFIQIIHAQVAMVEKKPFVFDNQSFYYSNQRNIVKQSKENNKIEFQYKLKEHNEIIDSINTYTINRQKSWHDSDKVNCRKAIQRSLKFVNLGFNNGHLFALIEYEKKFSPAAEVFFALIEFDKNLKFINYYIKPRYDGIEFNNANYGLTFNEGKLWLVNYSGKLYFQAYELNARKHFLDTCLKKIEFKPFLNESSIMILSNQNLGIYPNFKIVFNQKKAFICQMPLAVLKHTDIDYFIEYNGRINTYNDQIQAYKLANQNKNVQDITKINVPYYPQLIAIDDKDQQITALCYDSSKLELKLYIMNINQQINQTTHLLPQKMDKDILVLDGISVYALRKNDEFYDVQILDFK
jgi:hypothetical protein